MNADLKIGTNVFPHYVKMDVFRNVDALLHSSLKETVLDGFVHIQHKFKLRIHAWIVMPGTIKLIVSCDNETVAMEEVVDNFMNYTDKKLLQNIGNLKNEIKRTWLLNVFETNRRNQRLMFWHHRYTLEILNDDEQFTSHLQDMHESPVVSGIVWDAQNFMYSSAIDYIEDEPGLLPLVKLKVQDDLFF
jgi:REP element-mobilizing transposase RayT